MKNYIYYWILGVLLFISFDGFATQTPVIGKKKVLCVLVDFSDKNFSKTKKDFEELMNKPNYNVDGAKGSVRDFYLENSYGKLDLTTEVVGPFTLSHSASDFVNKKKGLELADEVVSEMFDKDFDFKKYAVDGKLELFYIIYAGNDNDIGGFKSNLDSPVIHDGVEIFSYACSSELRDNSDITRIGVICHELGHLLGAPDYYDTQKADDIHFCGTGKWDLMAAGSHNNEGITPAHFNIYQKIRFGWVVPKIINSKIQVEDMPNSAENPIVYKLPTPVAGEYYLLENRQQVGFDEHLPGHGLLIYHVHKDIENNIELDNNVVNAAHPQMIYPVDASSTYSEPIGTVASYWNINTPGCPFPGSSNKDSITSSSIPALFVWNSNAVMKPITEIKESNKLISFWYAKDDNKNNNEEGTTSNSNNPNSTAVMDPSGYVYEAVPSNRLEGVTATIYFKTNKGDIVLWDAEEYGQENPMYTNEYGEYGWDVPAGIWQVKYEKDGYQTISSEWLPVPPPQLDVNMAKVQPAQPEVIKIQGYESGINIEFDKFMQPDLLTTQHIIVERNGTSVTGTIALLNEEAGTGDSFVSKIRFIPNVPFETTDKVILTVKHEIKSYADIEMGEDFIRQVEIRKEMASITVTPVLELALHENEIVNVLVEPIEAAAGKKIMAKSISSSVAKITGEAVLDAEGKATLQVTGELPGSTVIYISVDNTDIKAETTVRVAMPKQLEQVAEPTASIPSGSTVEKNTTLTLSSNTNGATIYYTLNGSVPSATSGSEYTQPIIITEDVVIRAIAVKEDMFNSKIAVFEYYVEARKQVAEPTASIPSGSTVEKNTTLTLSSNTSGATIYYTLYGTIPSATSGLEYTQPIIITEDVVIRAIAVKNGMLNSEIAKFEYFISGEATSISNVESESKKWMIAFPNPIRVGEEFKIRFDIPIELLKEYYITIHTVLGEKVYENHTLQPVVKVQNLRQGYYIIRLSNLYNKNYQTQKIMVIN